ncbi:hypothetical protein HPC49_40375, partial [Pyxidicoccus fallax]|nr:hypothetical protein [Pyxidicoccus fallax]
PNEPVHQDGLRGLVERYWDNPLQLERVLIGQVQPGPLSPTEQAQLGRLLVEKHLSADRGRTLSRIGDEQRNYPNLARALGRSFQAGALTDGHLGYLLGPQGLGTSSRRGFEYTGIATLVAASGSPALQSTTATRSWELGAKQTERHAAVDFHTAAMRATGGSTEATQVLLQQAGPALIAAVDAVADLSRRAPVHPYTNRFSTALGTLLTGLSHLPSSQATNPVGARIVGHLSEQHLTAPALRKGFFDYLRSARTSRSWRGLGPASGNAFTQQELLTRFKDPAIRNHIVTEQYYRMSQALEELLPGQASWATFAVWASRQAGSAIRGEPLAGASGTNANGVRAISHGNTLGASEIAPLFGAFAQTLRSNPDASFQEVWRAAGAPNKPLLREAFQNYFEAYQLRRSGGGADAIAERVLVANTLVAQHEQTALQADIDSAMRVQGVSMWSLELDIPGRVLDLNEDLTGQFPPELRYLRNPRARQLEQQFGGWGDSRMESLFNLFRLNQRDAALHGDWVV